MRNHVIFGARFTSSVLLFAGLIFCAMASAQAQSQTSSQTQPCTPAANTSGASNAGTAANTAANTAKSASNGNASATQAEQQVSNAVKNLGSIFGKKKQQQTTSAPPPCPPAPSSADANAPGSAPAPSSAPSAAPGTPAQPANATASAAQAPVPAGQPAADPALASWTTADPFVPDAATGGVAPSATAALTGTTGAPNAPPDFAKLPDIGGFLRVGLTIDQSKDAIVKMHPTVKMSYGLAPNNQIGPVSRDGNPPLGGLKMHLSDEDIFFYYTQPPSRPQAAFTVVRAVNYPAPGIDYQKLVDALHQKYGPETMAGFYDASGNGGVPNMLYWLYDEQGHVITPDKAKGAPQGPQGAPFNCGGATVFWPPNGPSLGTWGNWNDQYRLNTLPSPKFCDAVVELLVHIVGGRGPVVNTVTTIYDQALLRRDVNEAGALAKAKGQQQQQQQLDQSKQAKPSL